MEDVISFEWGYILTLQTLDYNILCVGKIGELASRSKDYSLPPIA